MSTIVSTAPYAYRGTGRRETPGTPLNGYELMSQRRWQSNLAQLKAFIAENGRLPGRDNAPEPEQRLGMWISWNNRQHRLGNLADSQVSALLSLHPKMKSRIHGMTSEQRWKSTLVEVERFIEQNGKLPTAKRSEPEELKLASWVRRQKSKHARGQLNAIQCELLRSVPEVLAQKFAEKE